jgi:hypothetical protein
LAADSAATAASVFWLKLLLTPLLIGAATIAARRWGHSIGGWFAGLPLTSGPISLFLALEQGPEFARRAAEATLLGLLGVAVFCLAYQRAMTRMSPWATAALSLGAHLLAACGASLLPSSLLVATGALIGVLCLALIAIGAPQAPSTQTSPPRWDLWLRMIVATLMVVGITGAAAALGPRWSGLLSPFPVFACVLAVFAHGASGPPAAQRVLRGIILGSFAFASFFVVLALTLERTSLLLAYVLAAGAALGVNVLSLVSLLRLPVETRAPRTP